VYESLFEEVRAGLLNYKQSDSTEASQQNYDVNRVRYNSCH